MRGWVAALVLAGLSVPGEAGERAVTWTFDRIDRVGGLRTTVLGHPRVERTPLGKATVFDGVGDALYLGVHPLAGARAFTIEALIRPDGGAFEQRWMHLASDDPADQTRIMFEIRVVPQGWYLDSFIKGAGYAQVLIDPARTHPLGQWHHVAQTFDGVTYRAWVDGVLEGEAKVAGFTPQAPGKTAIGVRYNRVNFFHGALRMARFTPRALGPADFSLVRRR
jgi:hypothetical protein